MRATAATILLAAVTAGCGGAGGADPAEVAALRVRVDEQASQISDLRARLETAERNAARLEERIEAVPAAAVPSSGPVPAAAAEGDVDGDSVVGISAGEDAALAALETPAGQARLQAVLAAIRKREQEEEDRRREEELLARMDERVDGMIAEQLGLDEGQKARMKTVLRDTLAKGTALWRGARENRDRDAIAAIQEQAARLRKETEDQLATFLSVDQMSKVQEISGRRGDIFGLGRGFGGPTVPPAPAAPGGR
jgi:outer membrane murein-binding lipoprotein Lpp